MSVRMSVCLSTETHYILPQVDMFSICVVHVAPINMQIQCMGGTAGCSAFVPPVVQCTNRGFDGYDVQVS